MIIMATIIKNLSLISYFSETEYYAYGVPNPIITSTLNNGSLEFVGTAIEYSTIKDPQIASGTLQDAINSAKELSASNFYNVYGKVVASLIGEPYPLSISPFLGWFNFSGQAVAIPWNFVYISSDTEATDGGSIGQIRSESPFTKTVLYPVLTNPGTQDEVLDFYTASGGYSGLYIRRSDIPFEVSTAEPIGMEFLKDKYYIALDSEYRTVSPQFVIKYTENAELGPYNIATSIITGEVIDEDILSHDGINISLGPNAEVGTYNLNVEYQNYTAELKIVVVATESEIPKPGPYDPGGASGPGGGNGQFGKDEISDIIFTDIPGGSSESDISSAGLFTRYVMSTATTRAFGDWLFSDNIIDTIVKEFMALIFASPMEAIISMISYPFSIGSLPGVATAASNVFYGNKDSGIASLGRLTNGFATIDWGTVAIAEYWGNFLDYSPHTKIELYLPWSTGFVDLDPNDVMNSTISIVTNIELDKGTCIHNVYNGRGAVIGQYSGVCGKQLPITALDTSGKALSAVVAATAVAVSAGAAGITAAGAAATESAAVGALRGAKAAGLSIEGQLTAAESMRSIMSKFHKDYTPVAKAGSKVAAVSGIAAARIPPHIQRSGSFTGNGSGMGVQYPYFILSRPDQSVPDQYGAYVGYPSNIYSSLGALSGYTEVGSIYLDGIACTENERAEIDALLKGGVIL